LGYCCRRDRPSWVKITYTPYFDGHLWRKYGQKKIKDAEYPRYVKITCQVCWYAQFEAQGFGLSYLCIGKVTIIMISRVHLQTSLLQSFVLIFQNEIWFGEVVHNFELKRFGGAHKDHQLIPLMISISCMWKWHEGPILVTHINKKTKLRVKSSMPNSYLMMKWSNFHLLLFLLVVGIVFSHYVSFFI